MARPKKILTTTETPLAPIVPFDATAKPVEVQYKTGEWVYYCYELLQVNKLDKDNRVIEVGDGNAKVTSKEGTNLSADILPLNPENKVASDLFLKIAQEFGGYSAFGRLNVQLVHPWLTKQWLGYAAASGDKAKQEAILKGVQELGKTIIDAIKQLQSVKFQDKPLFA